MYSCIILLLYLFLLLYSNLSLLMVKNYYVFLSREMPAPRELAIGLTIHMFREGRVLYYF